MSSDNQDIFEAMRFAAVVNKVRFPHAPERWIGAREVWAMATSGGARVLGLADDIGAIQPGRKADLILLRAASVFLKPTTNPLRALVYAETGASVETVMVGGKLVVENGRVLTLDESKISGRAQAAVDKLVVRNRDLRSLAQRLEPFVRSACRACAAEPFPVNRYAVPLASSR
jgi:guanine deaminase